MKQIDSAVWIYMDELIISRTYVSGNQLIFTIEMSGSEEIRTHLEHPIIEQMEFIGEF